MTILRPYRRLLLKLSGEMFMGPSGSLDPCAVSLLADHIKTLHQDHQVAIVMGGGNFIRGEKLTGFPRAEADELGMLGTIINGRALRVFLDQLCVPCHLFQAKGDHAFCGHQARQAMAEKKVVLCAGGTGSAFVTTDTAAVLRALDLGCDVVLKATNVDGIYDVDPKTSPDAQFFPRLTHQEALDRHLRVMDQAAFALAQDNRLPIIVFSLQDGLLQNDQRHTLVTSV